MCIFKQQLRLYCKYDLTDTGIFIHTQCVIQRTQREYKNLFTTSSAQLLLKSESDTYKTFYWTLLSQDSQESDGLLK